jgi:cobaltochelatase CobN
MVHKRLVLNNKWATAEIVERLLEANKRGYWKATEEEIERLKEAYLEIEGWIEERIEEG